MWNLTDCCISTIYFIHNMHVGFATMHSTTITETQPNKERSRLKFGSIKETTLKQSKMKDYFFLIHKTWVHFYFCQNYFKHYVLLECNEYVEKPLIANSERNFCLCNCPCSNGTFDSNILHLHLRLFNMELGQGHKKNVQ